MPDETKPFFVTLPDRAALRVAGDDAFSFLQNLISNDMALLDRQPCLYACLLTPQGKFLFDFFISRDGGGFLLDCEGGARAQALLQKLTLYRLRSKVELRLDDPRPVYVIIGGTLPPDPRHPALGHRTFLKPVAMEERPFTEWDRLRITCGVPDGSRDMVPEKSTLIESRIDVFHGISFTKGCYIGQEITARMHHRGLAKKHLLPIKITLPAPAPGDELFDDQGRYIGEIRSVVGDDALALIKLKE
ncbi:MAG: folate-binding protein YgfZ [Micavibrio aeruginosavorus]|uniref:Folate-binding protein YgfZ n=1 Tax=Micavibrio aeruginosavorus TaxID=349221 RepID=A0A7T5R456_9BACT|nr:MAG: folate-binding protein YgfZ [Micavibrio aeruginosavorus]